MKKIVSILLILTMFSSFLTIPVHALPQPPPEGYAVETEDDITLLFRGMFRNLTNHFFETLNLHEFVRVTKVKVVPGTITVPLHSNTPIKCNITPSKAYNKNIVWKTSNAQVASVYNGVLTGISVGKTTIYAIAEDGGFYDVITVTVTEPEPSFIIGAEWTSNGPSSTKSITEISVHVEMGITEFVCVYPKQTQISNIKITVHDPSVAKVIFEDDKSVTFYGLKKGITVADFELGSFKKSVKITVF